MIKVEGHSNLYRDLKSGAIINCDENAYNQYMNIVRNRQIQKNEIEKIKNDIEEIKDLLKELIKSKN
jgi:hypothetical protein